MAEQFGHLGDVEGVGMGIGPGGRLLAVDVVNLVNVCWGSYFIW